MNCKICNKEFKSIKELSRHLLGEHNYTTAQMYEYYDYSFETGKAICPICGREFVMTKRQINGFKKNPNKSIGCCTFCSKAIIMLTHGSPLANPEIYQKTKETLMKNYGVEHPAQSKTILEKMKATTFDHLGVENSMQSEEIQKKRKKTNLERYGNEEYLATKEARETIKEKMLEKYGVENAFQSEKIKEGIKKVHLEKRGVEHPMQSKESQEKMRKTNMDKRGVEFPLQSKQSMEKMKKTNMDKRGVEYAPQAEDVKKKKKESTLKNYGVEYPLQSFKVREKIKEKCRAEHNVDYYLQVPEIREKGVRTNLKEHGVKYFCQHENCYKNNYSRVSKVNRKFKELLNENDVNGELEFILENMGYDLKVGNVLIEIDPWFTHNSTKGPVFGNKEGRPRTLDYHLSKTLKAREHGYECIHIFDWDDWKKVTYLLQDKERVNNCDCKVKEINIKTAKEFLEEYHIQGSTNHQYDYGLYHENKLVQVMTFRELENSKGVFELTRMCTLPTLSIDEGYSKLLNYFEKQVKPKSIISYCDLSKFNGDVYEKLGFKATSQVPPIKHWYNPKTKEHIINPFNKDNEQLSQEYGYVEIYDCGQIIFENKLVSD